MNITNKLQKFISNFIEQNLEFPDYQHLYFGIDSCFKTANRFKISYSQVSKSKLILCVSLPNSKIIEFFQIWPLSQWVYSLIGLVALYALTTYLYNKRLTFYKNEMSLSFRFWMIFSDLAVNLALGLYYLDYRETIMGQLMLKCPIAVSPVIFLVELLLVILIKEYEIFNRRKKNNKK